MSAGRKAIVFVEGNLTMNGRPNPADGNGLFMVLVNGNINIDPGVTSIEGVFVADGTIRTGSKTGTDDDSVLTINGTLIAWGGGVFLDRDLPQDVNEPGEIIYYRPDMILNIPKYFSEQTVTRKEVNP